MPSPMPEWLQDALLIAPAAALIYIAFKLDEIVRLLRERWPR